MPEGPELHLTSVFINRVCRGRIFGKIYKSEISKCPVVTPPSERYHISATARGKEIKLILSPTTLNGVSKLEEKKVKRETLSANPLTILFTFGLAGKFEFNEASELKKHAHLNFYTADQQPDMVLSFNDYMRFGKWMPNMDFAFKERGPCVLTEYKLFREKVLQNLDSSVFNKPICEALLNQKYFNGIGNYLRAEILHRLAIPPFVSARSVLEPLALDDIGDKSGQPDILQLCHQLPKEVVQLEGSWYDGADREDRKNNFNCWLQCYYQDGMKNIADHNKRTIWYSGPLGPLAPKETVVRGKKKSKKRKNDTSSEESQDEKPKKKPTKRKNTDQEESPSKPKKLKRNRKDNEESSSKPKKIKPETDTEDSASSVPSSPLKRVTRSRVKKASEAKVAKKRLVAKVKAKVVKVECKVESGIVTSGGLDEINGNAKVVKVECKVESGIVANGEVKVGNMNGDIGDCVDGDIVDESKVVRNRRSRRK